MLAPPPIDIDKRPWNPPMPSHEGSSECCFRTRDVVDARELYSVLLPEPRAQEHSCTAAKSRHTMPERSSLIGTILESCTPKFRRRLIGFHPISANASCGALLDLLESRFGFHDTFDLGFEARGFGGAFGIVRMRWAVLRAERSTLGVMYSPPR